MAKIKMVSVPTKETVTNSYGGSSVFRPATTQSTVQSPQPQASAQKPKK